MRQLFRFSATNGLMFFATFSAVYLFLFDGQDLPSQNTVAIERTSSMAQMDADLETQATAAVDDDRSESAETDNTPATIAEARVRAKLLHESFAGALQVMHRDYFREGEKLKLPSKSLEDVFSEMAKSQNVQLRWLAVNANAMSVAHKPKNSFEKKAVAALSSGKEDFESATADSFKYVGSIRLSASCVKCHVRNRTSNDERKAGLVITMPLKTRAEK